jgi:DNA-binding NtrC family response regulator
MAERIRLLMVDDETDFVEYMTKRLTQHEFEVTAYTDPVRALDDTRDRTFDVALLDLKMPRIDGETLLGKLKARDPRLEIIILTAHGSPASAFRTSRDGAYEYLLKPCEFETLLESISKAYARRIQTLHTLQAEHVDSLLTRAAGLRAKEVLKEIKDLHDRIADVLPVQPKK